MEPSEQDTDPQVPTEPTTEPAPDQPPAAAPAPELTLEDAEPGVPLAPDLDAVTPEVASTSGAATNLDLPSLELPHPAYPEPQAAPAAYQTPGQAYGQTPYAVPQPSPHGQAPGQQYSQAPYATPEPPAQPYGQAPSQPYSQPGYAPQQYGQQLAYGGSQLNAAEENMWASAAHWSAILASVIGLGFLGPLIVLLTQGTKSARVRANAVESLNFEITFIISMVVSVLLIFVLVGIVTTILLPLAWLILRILAAVQTSSGQDYRYPVNMRIVK